MICYRCGEVVESDHHKAMVKNKLMPIHRWCYGRRGLLSDANKIKDHIVRLRDYIVASDIQNKKTPRKEEENQHGGNFDNVPSFWNRSETRSAAEEIGSLRQIYPIEHDEVPREVDSDIDAIIMEFGNEKMFGKAPTNEELSRLRREEIKAFKRRNDQWLIVQYALVIIINHPKSRSEKTGWIEGIDHKYVLERLKSLGFWLNEKQLQSQLRRIRREYDGLASRRKVCSKLSSSRTVGSG